MSVQRRVLATLRSKTTQELLAAIERNREKDPEGVLINIIEDIIAEREEPSSDDQGTQA